MASKIWIILFLLKTARGVEALFVTCRDVTGNGLSLGNGFGALQSDDIAWHKSKWLVDRRISWLRWFLPLRSQSPPQSSRRER